MNKERNSRNSDIAARVKASLESSKPLGQDRIKYTGNSVNNSGTDIRRDQRESIDDIKKRMKADMEKLAGVQGWGLQGDRRNASLPRADIPDSMRNKIEERKSSASARSTDEVLKELDKLKNFRRSSTIEQAAYTAPQQKPIHAESVGGDAPEQPRPLETIQGFAPTERKSGDAEIPNDLPRIDQVQMKDNKNYRGPVDGAAGIQRKRSEAKIGVVDASPSATRSLPDESGHKSSGTTQRRAFNPPIRMKNAPRSSLPQVKDKRTEAFNPPKNGGSPRGNLEHASATLTESNIPEAESRKIVGRPMIFGVDLLGAFEENPWN